MSDVHSILDRAEPPVRETHAAILASVRQFGPVAIEPKKTSIHIVAGSAFAGVHPQLKKLRLNLRLARGLSGPRIKKVEQVSASRFHNEMDLFSPAEVDAELVGWLREAYDLGVRKT